MRIAAIHTCIGAGLRFDGRTLLGWPTHVWQHAQREGVEGLENQFFMPRAPRVAGRDRDTLQSAIQLLRSTDFKIDVQFINYRTN